MSLAGRGRAGWAERSRHRCALAAALLVAPGAASSAQPESLTTLPLEDLMRVEVVSASRKSERYADVAAAVFVITQDDIRRSGATTLPEVLRLAPGVEVARITADLWAITVRGFNGQYANKLLVLVDGRSVYTPAFSGVYWDAPMDLDLAEIDRIEVIRGPGGAAWGINAVNGVINIITKNAADSQGGRIEAGAGTLDRYRAAARWGGATKGGTQWRVQGSANRRDGYPDDFGMGNEDRSWNQRAAFRVDSAPANDSWTVTGDVHRGESGLTQYEFRPQPQLFELVPRMADSLGADVVGRYTHNAPSGASWTATGYADYLDKDIGITGERRNTLSAELVARLAPHGAHDLQWGMALRTTTDRLASSESVQVTPDRETLRNASVFLQDEVRVASHVRVIGGIKLEHNDYTGWEAQPTLRTAIGLGSGHSVWVAASQAVRAPSRTSRGLAYTLDSPYDGRALRILGTPDIPAEEQVSFEAGYRLVKQRWSLDVAAFRNDYHHLETGIIEPGHATIEPLPIAPYAALIVPMYLRGQGTSTVSGIEVALDVRFTDNWRLTGAASWLSQNYGPSTGNPALERPRDLPNDSPPQHWTLRSSHTFGSLELDLVARHSGTLGGTLFVHTIREAIPGYDTGDVRLAWHSGRTLEIAASGQNLFGPAHLEFISGTFWVPPTRVSRSGFLSATWRF